MNTNQMVIIALICCFISLLIWNRWRYDFVALGVLIIGVITKIIPIDVAFSGFSHPAVIAVASIFVMSYSLSHNGATYLLGNLLAKTTKNFGIFLSTICFVTMILSGFINNVGALLIMMPIAINIAKKFNKSPANVLMPLSFSSILGGLTTLIGTPPNMIISLMRQQLIGEPFAMFDFARVGLPIAIIGVIFIVIIGWRLIPKNTTRDESLTNLLNIGNSMNLMPLVNRKIQINSNYKKFYQSVAIFGFGILLATLNVLPVHICFLISALLMVFGNMIPIKDFYNCIDWSIIVLIAAIIPLSYAFENTGTAQYLLNLIMQYVDLGPVGILIVLLIITMLLTDIMNNTATAVLMAPLAISIANAYNVNVDSFLMIIAIGTSCSFLTPIGHQNNTIIWGAGGYKFSDYWKIGLPLDIIIVTIAVPLVLYLWPLR